MCALQDDRCEAALLRGSLRHSWLENEIIDRRPDDIAKWYGTFSPERVSLEKGISPKGEFYLRLGKARELADIMITSFSPAQLVENSVLARLPMDVKQLIKGILHNTYLEKTGIAELTSPLEDAINKFALELQHFTETWYSSRPPAGSEAVRGGFLRLQERARELHEILGCLPEGIVLP